jgi:hypothetical protein
LALGENLFASAWPENSWLSKEDLGLTAAFSREVSGKKFMAMEAYKKAESGN